MAAKMSEQSDLRNFFGKNNTETDQEPTSSGCSVSVKSESYQQPAPKKDRKFLSIKWLRYENDLMFCDTCLTAKACSNPFTKDVLPSKILLLYKRWDPIFNDGTPIIIKVESQGPPNIQLGVKPCNQSGMMPRKKKKYIRENTIRKSFTILYLKK